jgi:hypothetical protein
VKVLRLLVHMLDRADMGTWVLDMILIDVLSYGVKAMPQSTLVCYI